MKKIIVLCVMVLSTLTHFSQSTTSTASVAGTYVFSVPCGVTSVTVEAWGGGGAGGGGNVSGGSGGSGGGGAAYVTSVIAVTPGATINFTVGSGGGGGTGNGGNGTSSIFSTITANGGTGGTASGGAVGTGGTGSGGTSSNGSNGVVGTAIGGVGGNGGNGGTGGLGGAANGNGSSGTAPGGGGGGGGPRTGGSTSGGNGGTGRVIITYAPNASSGCNPCSAIPITSFPYTYSGTTAGGFNFMTGGCAGNAPATTGNGNDVFFAVTVAANTYLNLQLTGTNSTFYNEISVLSGACGGPWSCVANGAWGGGLQTTTGPGSVSTAANSPCKKVWFQTAGTYYIKVDGDAGANGPFTLSVSSVTASAGENCTNAIGLSSGSPVGLNSTNCLYTAGTDDPSPSSLFCAGTVENTNWFLFQSNGNGSPVNVTVNSVNCNTGYFSPGFPSGSFYSASGQFGIVTGTCGGTFSSATTCTNLSTGSTYSTNLPNTSITNYYFVWDGNGGAECSYSITVTNVTPLPIELEYFNAKVNGNNVDLSWATLREKNNDYFIVERSLDAVNFKPVAKVKGAVNSSIRKNYFVSDSIPLSGVSYYRLMQVDLSGEFKHTSIRSVNFNSYPKEMVVDIIPNPTGDDATLRYVCNTAEPGAVTFYNQLGLAVLTMEINCELGENQKQIDLAGLEAGIYFVLFKTSTSVKKIKLVKQ